MPIDEKLIELIEPSKELFEIADKYAKLAKKALPNAKISLIGSLAIPMIGKKEIDLLAESEDVKKAQEELGKMGFGIGPIIDGEGFCKSKKYGIVCDLHIIENGSKKAKKYFNFISFLKKNPSAKKEYEMLKKSLMGKSKEEYKKRKNEFMKKILF